MISDRDFFVGLSTKAKKVTNRKLVENETERPSDRYNCCSGVLA